SGWWPRSAPAGGTFISPAPPQSKQRSDMATQWDDWLRKLAADGKGGLGLRGKPAIRAIDRGLPYEYQMAIGADVSADAFSASIRATPDATGATLADFTVTVGSYADEVTPVTLSLTDVQTAA